MTDTPRSGARPLDAADQRELALAIHRLGGMQYAAAKCCIAIATLRRARDGQPVTRPTREAITRALVLAGGAP